MIPFLSRSSVRGDAAPPRGRARTRATGSRRELSLHDAVFLVVASVVGSGIFLTPGAIAERLPHPGLILAVWVVGGAALARGRARERGARRDVPARGRRLRLPARGVPSRSRASWPAGSRSSAIFAGTVATLAAGFAAGAPPVLGLSGPGSRAARDRDDPGRARGSTAIGVRHGARANNVTGWIKVGVLAVLRGRGAALGARRRREPAAASSTGIRSAAPPLAFALALSPVLFSYLGWNATVYVASEIRDPAPQRAALAVRRPRALHRRSTSR